MDLFKLTARLTMDDSGFAEKVKAAAKEMDAAKKSAQEYRSDVMKLATELRKTEGLGKGDALKKAYATIDKSLYDLGEKHEEAAEKVKKHWWQMGKSAGEYADTLSAKTIVMGNLLTDLARKAVGVGKDVVGTGLTYNQQMEDYTTNFKVMLGSLTAAESKVEELKTMAAKTPFEMTDLAEATKELLTFNVASGKTTTVMTQLGDISLGNAQRFSGLATAYGKINSQGKLTRETVDMLITNGFNPMLYITKETGESMSELEKRMSAGRVSVDELDLAMRRATSEGGMYYKGMEEGSKTMSGQLSTLQDNWNAFLGEAMSPVSEQLSSKILPKAIESLDKLSAALFGVKGDADGAKKALFLNAAGEEIDPSANLLTWVQDLMTEWTNGKAEDDTTVKAFVDSFNENSESIKTALQARIDDMSNPMTPKEMEEAKQRIADITAMQAEVEALLEKRAGGYITAEEETRLNTIISTLQTMQAEVEAAAGFEENIVSPWERFVSAAGDASADFLTKAADFLVWCAVDGEGANKALDGAAIALGAIAGLKSGGLIGALAGGAAAAIITNLDKIASAAKRAYDWLSKLTGVEVSYSKQEAYDNGLGETWGVDEDTGRIYYINEDGSKSFRKKHATGLDYVPYDEYPALLHEGEAVLTKAEARAWRNGDGVTDGGAVRDLIGTVRDLIDAVKANPTVLNVNGRTLAYATVGDNARAGNDRARDINIGRVR